MRHVILFSTPSEEVLQQIFPDLFPTDLPRKVLAYMPSDGALQGKSYERLREAWQDIAREHDADFLAIDNSLIHAEEEQKKLLAANILVITGGNPCMLLRNLRRSGLDQTVLEFARRDPGIIAGYSAGAMVCTPSVALSTVGPWQDDNIGVGLTDFEALHLVDYEVFPHYSDDMQPFFDRYVQMAKYPIKPLRDDEFFIHKW